MPTASRSSPTPASASSRSRSHRRRRRRRTRCSPPSRRPTRPRRSPTRSRSSSARDPRSKPVPDVKGQTVDSAQQVLTASGFTKPVRGRGRQHRRRRARSSALFRLPDESFRWTRVIQIQVSEGNQFVMPDVRGGFWTDVEPNLRNAYGWTGPADQGPRRAEQRPADQRGGDSEPGAGHAGQIRGSDHAGVRVVAACTALATSSSSWRTNDSAGAAPQ